MAHLGGKNRGGETGVCNLGGEQFKKEVSEGALVGALFESQRADMLGSV